MVLWKPTRPSRTNTATLSPPRCPFHYRKLECKSRISRDTWSNRQVSPWSTKWSRANANRVLLKKQTNKKKGKKTHNTLVIANTLFHQHKRQLYTWTPPNGQYLNHIDYTCNQRWRSSIKSTNTKPGSDCGSDHKLLFAKFRLKVKRVGETTRPFRYDLNQILYDYTVEVKIDSSNYIW